MPFELNFTEEADSNLRALEEDKGLVKRLKAVRKALGYLEVNPRHPHIPKESPLNSVNHQSWRTRAVLNSQDTAGDGIHYSVVFSASVEDLARIKAMLLRFIDEKRAVISPSPCEELACFACDLFVV